MAWFKRGMDDEVASGGLHWGRMLSMLRRTGAEVDERRGGTRASILLRDRVLTLHLRDGDDSVIGEAAREDVLLLLRAAGFED